MFAKPKVPLETLHKEIDSISNAHNIKLDAAFVLWFLTTYLVGDKDEKTAIESLTGKEGGRKGEKNMDAILIDHKHRHCNVVQCKFHISEKRHTEKLNDIIGLADLAKKPWIDKQSLYAFCDDLAPIAKYKFKEVAKLVKKENYKLNLYYVTNGECSNSVIKDAEVALNGTKNTKLFIISRKQILSLFNDYLDDITPHLPPIKLNIIKPEEVIGDTDNSNGIKSWVLEVSGRDIVNAYSKAGRNIFAKNVRGWLDKTKVNRAIDDTIKKEPANFWYYNNGITMVCRKAITDNKGEITIEGSQIINGQQTVRALAENDHRLKLIKVLLRVIQIPPSYESNESYDEFVDSIIKANNRQNHISSRELVSNDYIQIFLERELRKIGYQYIRKTMSKSEAKSNLGQGYIQISMKELAQSVAACIVDPGTSVKKGQALFEGKLYLDIFGSKDLLFYLSKFWLMKQVSKVQRSSRTKSSDYSYSKWLVLNFLWNEIEETVGYGKGQRKFVAICNNKWNHEGDKALNNLRKAINEIFRASLKFYKSYSQKDEEYKNIATFFKRAKLDSLFDKFWKPRERKKFNDYIRNFVKCFQEVSEE